MIGNLARPLGAHPPFDQNHIIFVIFYMAAW